MAVIALLICTACSCTEKNRAIHLTEEQADEFLSSRFHRISGIESADLTTEAVGGKSGRAPGSTDTMTYGTVTIAKKQADVYSGEYIWEEWGDDTKEIYADLMKKVEQIRLTIGVFQKNLRGTSGQPPETVSSLSTTHRLGTDVS